MSDLVEKVRLAITLQSHITMTDADARAAIKAVAEWLTHTGDGHAQNAAFLLLKQLEKSK
jgi:hypothetical protein